MNARTLFVAVAAAAIAAAPAVATEPKTLDQGASVGTFDGSGTGTVILQGQLTAFGRVQGGLIVRDAIGGATVKLNGVVQRPRIIGTGVNRVRVYRFARVNKAFYVKGRGIRITLTSAPTNTLSISAFGRGTVNRLSGQGTFSLNAGDRQEWSAATPPLKIKPAPKQTLRP